MIGFALLSPDGCRGGGGVMMLGSAYLDVGR